jgi:hypothetical protein
VWVCDPPLAPRRCAWEVRREMTSLVCAVVFSVEHPVCKICQACAFGICRDLGAGFGAGSLPFSSLVGGIAIDIEAPSLLAPNGRARASVLSVMLRASPPQAKPRFGSHPSTSKSPNFVSLKSSFTRSFKLMNFNWRPATFAETYRPTMAPRPELST